MHHRAGVGIEAFEVASLPFGKDDVEGERRFAGARGPRHDREAVARQRDGDVLEVVFPRAFDADFFARGLVRAGGLDRGKVEEALAARVARKRPSPGRERFARQGACCRHRIGRTLEDEFPSFVAAFWSEFDHPVGGVEYVEVVFDGEYRVPERDESIEDVDESVDVREVESRCRFVEDEEFSSFRPIAAGDPLSEMGGQFETLSLAPRKGREWLTEREVPETDEPQVGKRRDHCGVPSEKLFCLIYGEFEDIGDRIVLAVRKRCGDLEDFVAIASSVAFGTGEIDVGEELHLDVFGPRAEAARAAPVPAVKGEIAACEPLRYGFGGLSENRADRVERSHVAHGVAAGSGSHGALIDEDDVRGNRSRKFLLARFRGDCQAELARERGNERVGNEGRLAGTRNACHGDEASERNRDRQVFEVVFRCVFDRESGRRVRHLERSACDAFAPREVVGRERGGGERFAGGAVEDDLAARTARARTEVDEAVAGEHHLRIVFDDDERVARLSEATQYAVDAIHVTGVQADRRFVENEERIDEIRAERRREVHAFDFTAREGASLSIEREIGESHIAQKPEARGDFVEEQPVRFVEVVALKTRLEERGEAPNRHLHEFVKVEARKQVARFGRQTRARYGKVFGRKGATLLKRAVAPRKRFVLEVRTLAGRTGRVGAVA